MKDYLTIIEAAVVCLLFPAILLGPTILARRSRMKAASGQNGAAPQADMAAMDRPKRLRRRRMGGIAWSLLWVAPLAYGVVAGIRARASIWGILLVGAFIPYLLLGAYRYFKARKEDQLDKLDERWDVD